MKEGDGLMNITRLTNNRICTILREKLYSMTDNENESVYEPLQLNWTLPIDSPQGLIVVFQNIFSLLDYVHKRACSKSVVDEIIKNDIYPVTNAIGNEYDFIISGTLIAICSVVDDFSDQDELMEWVYEIIGKFICLLEVAREKFDSKETDSANEKEIVHGIDTTGLELGMVVKNYKEMCKILIEEVCEGNSKKAQLKEWARYFLWEKKGQKFIILDIYDEPIPKDDGRKNKNIYVQYIEVILMKILSKQKNYKDPFYITTNQLWRLLGMINNNYKNISLDTLNDMITDYEVTQFDMKKFYQRCNQRLREILFSSLHKLEDKALIKYDIETVIAFLGEKGKMTYKPANDIQKKKILKAERKALLDMGLESKQHAYAKFKETEFFERVNTYLNEWYGWEYTFNRIKINYNKSDILETVYKDEVKLRSDFEEMKLQRLGLNDRVVEALYKNAQTMAENRHKKAEREYQKTVNNFMEEWGGTGSIPESFLPTKSDLHIFDYQPYFVEIQNRLTDELICIRKAQEKRTVLEFNDDESKELDGFFKN